MYKKVQKRQMWSWLHLIIGRGGITLGIVNGGLGLYISGAEWHYKRTYAIVAAVIWGFWMGVAMWTEIKKVRERRKERYEAVAKFKPGTKMPPRPSDQSPRSSGQPPREGEQQVTASDPPPAARDQAQRSTEQPARTSGQAPRSSEQPRRLSGQAPRSSEQRESVSEQSPRASGQQPRTSGQPAAATPA